MSTHTPGPWEIDEESEDNAGQTALSITSDNRPGYICGIHCAEGVELDVIDRANAAFIVRACNAHGELVKALKMILKTHDPIETDEIMEDAREQARAAIAKAEGRD